MSNTGQIKDAVVDACCLVNICSTKNPLAILANSGLRWLVPKLVKSESLFIYRPDNDGILIKQPIEFEGLIAAGCLEVYASSADEELDLYVRLAVELDDGEAMALAVAKHHDCWFASDDRKARRIAKELNVKLLSTPELINRWATATSPTPSELAVILKDIQTFAHFAPGPSAPLYEWWVRSQKGAPE